MKIRVETEQRLERWAEWSQRNADGALGYPRRSLEARLMDEGWIPTSFGSKPLEIDEEAEEIDGFMVELGQYYRAYAEALKLEYLHRGAITTKAAQLGVSRSQFLMYRDAGKIWMDGRLHATQKRHRRL